MRYGFYPQGGRPPKHGDEFRFAKPETWPEAAITTVTDTAHYGKAEAQAWDRVHPRLTHRSAWLEHDGELPVVEGTLVRLKGRAPLQGTGSTAGLAVVLQDRCRPG